MKTARTADRHVILGIHIQNRVKNAGRVQKVLTAHGGMIRTRLGLHEVDGSGCPAGGVILLELAGGCRGTRIAAALRAIRGVDVKKLVFTHR